MNKNLMRGRRCSGEPANGSEAHIHQGVSGELLRDFPVIGQLKWAGSALGQRIRALLSSAAGGAHASFGPHAYVLAFGNGLEGFAVDKQKNVVVDWTGKPGHMEPRIVLAPRKSGYQIGRRFDRRKQKPGSY